MGWSGPGPVAHLPVTGELGGDPAARCPVVRAEPARAHHVSLLAPVVLAASLVWRAGARIPHHV